MFILWYLLHVYTLVSATCLYFGIMYLQVFRHTNVQVEQHLLLFTMLLEYDDFE